MKLLKMIKAYIPYLIYKTMTKPTKEQALKELDEIESRQKQLRKIIEDADKPRDIKDIVFDIPSAIEYLGDTDVDVMEYRRMQKADLSNKTILGKEIELFCKALSEKTVFDWEDTNQEKWYIWFDYSKKGSGFVDGFTYDYCSYCSCISARHVFKNRDHAVHATECILPKLKEYFN